MYSEEQKTLLYKSHVLQFLLLREKGKGRGKQRKRKKSRERGNERDSETAEKWQKCNLVSGMASVASDMGWL